jgi:hypothetical protein
VSISVVCNIDQGLTTAAMSDVRILDVGMQYPSYVSE